MVKRYKKLLINFLKGRTLLTETTIDCFFLDCIVIQINELFFIYFLDFRNGTNKKAQRIHFKKIRE